MNGTSSEQAASDQSGPFVRKRRNWMYQAPKATMAAKKMRPARASGVVLGSEIMKKVKRGSAPFSRRCRGVGVGPPRERARPRTRAPWKREKGGGGGLGGGRVEGKRPRQGG